MVLGPIAGLGDVTLGSTGDGKLTLTHDTSLSLAFADADPVFDTFSSNLGDIERLIGLGFEDVVAGLEGFVNYLEGLENDPILSTDLPLFNNSVNGLLDYAEEFRSRITPLNDAPATTVDQLLLRISGALGIAPPAVGGAGDRQRHRAVGSAGGRPHARCV